MSSLPHKTIEVFPSKASRELHLKKKQDTASLIYRGEGCVGRAAYGFGESIVFQIFAVAMVKSLISFKSTSSNGCVRVACPLKRSISDQIEATNSLELTALEIENLRMIENLPWWRHGPGNSNVSRALCLSVVLSNGLPKKTTTWRKLVVALFPKDFL